MVAMLARIRSTGRRALRVGWPLLFVFPGSILATLWWLNEPLEDPSSVSSAPTPPPIAATDPEPPDAERPRPSWPEERVEGEPAKQRLLDLMQVVHDDLQRVNTYTATFRKRERIRGTLGPEQTLTLKARNRPFSIYLKFLAPKAGKEVVYAEGRHDNQVIAHNGDWTRKLVPRLRVPPDSALALADSRHPVTDAGLHNLAARLLHFRKLDMGDAHASTVLDWAEGPDGRPWPRSIHTHAVNTGDRPFTRVEVLYDPESLVPRRIWGYDWPASDGEAEPELGEMYGYDDLVLNAPLSDLDFDPANPAYEFTRF